MTHLDLSPAPAQPDAAPARPDAAAVPPDVAAVLAGLVGHPALAAPPACHPAPVTAAELARLARQAAADHSVWAAEVRFDTEHRSALRLAADARHELWLMTWLPGQSTDLHHHVGASGAFAVVRGVVEERTVHRQRQVDGAAAQQSVRRLTVGQVRVFGPHHLHQVANPGPDPAVCVYVYAPARPATAGDDAAATASAQVVAP